jgi:hypothetical protein
MQLYNSVQMIDILVHRDISMRIYTKLPPLLKLSKFTKKKCNNKYSCEIKNGSHYIIFYRKEILKISSACSCNQVNSL